MFIDTMNTDTMFYIDAMFNINTMWHYVLHRHYEHRHYVLYSLLSTLISHVSCLMSHVSMLSRQCPCCLDTSLYLQDTIFSTLLSHVSLMSHFSCLTSHISSCTKTGGGSWWAEFEDNSICRFLKHAPPPHALTFSPFRTGWYWLSSDSREWHKHRQRVWCRQCNCGVEWA